MDSTPILKTSSLRFAHEASKTWNFDDVELFAGNQLLVLGNSGSGKTTLLHLLCGLLSPLDGAVQIDGNDLTTLSPKSIDKLRGDKIGMIFQQPHFIQSLNVRQNIELAADLGNSKSNADIEQLMTQLNISDLAKNNINTLSEGEKQRVGIARALANKPLLLLADEPTSALDDMNCDAVIKLLLESSKSNDCALVVVTHDSRIRPYFSNQLNIQER